MMKKFSLVCCLLLFIGACSSGLKFSHIKEIMCQVWLSNSLPDEIVISVSTLKV